MPSALDLRLESAYNLITGPGGPIQVGSVERFGRQLPFITNAPTNLADYVAYFSAMHGDATFLVEGDERLSFKQVYAAARKVAAGLIDGHGVQRGDRVGLAMRNANAWCVAYIGILLAGGCATLLNGWWQGGELAAGIDDAEAKLVIADAQRAARLAEPGVSHGAQVVALDITKPIDEAIAPLAAGGSAETALPVLTGQDLATILFTSGSTGQSKGAYSRHEAVVQAIFNYVTQTASIVHLLTEDGLMSDIQPATLICTPLFHVTAEIPVFLQSFALGRKLVLMPKWNADEAMRLIQDEKCNYFVGVPLMSYEILVSPNRKNYDLSTCKSYAGGGAPRPPEHVRRLASEMGDAKPLLGYGLTETNAVGCGIINENYVEKPLSTGPASKPLVDLAILDELGNELPQGSVGEVCMRSVCNFEGYWNNEAATKAAFFDNGYFRSGDLGYLDADGYLFIVDRKKDIIIRGGENISCQEVEAAIYEHAEVNECAVFGLPDERLGECVGAVVWMKPGSALTADELTAFLNARLAPYKVPCRIWMSNEALPKLGSEKIDKVSLRNRYREEYKSEVTA
ncbi:MULTISPECIES: class I adenylate-forming enzyme family protein [unclassified Sphingopyxis]|jgi:acyl-CoA synthetase (AMP-forming)/AMP-acid ligase II|uniref:class I adenylate-forming enzyme family protein n=1 Tax=unclassified Sphingopyxis TaxID=2614943 RepID=UPI0007306FF8|nr:MULTISPECIES: class I adenylate-forming enzyme family protein [unclassified Sphingopyxis]KTE26607.1 AMP-dependent synthetase [Sphingopyxis sp. H057]KTE53013.1 AMP-dependent synthetase [Sphingopyxis sp. H073]KTE55203.1 AMP-dependent synthetase [Sphingopyxis sp. H071]KTE58692.1 AMP-dependent synthetase [Sphingopyxis sp. H107]KTE61289.1 AMP-dependent synthetase [Sphingopyxis sp. H100]